MKRSREVAGTCAVLIAFVLVAQPPTLRAESTSSPAMILKKKKWAMGLGTGALLKRGLSGGADMTVYQGGHFRGYGLTEWLSVYGNIGGAYLSVDDGSIQLPNETSSMHSFGAGLLVSGGLKARLWESANKRWEWDSTFQYTHIRARHRSGNDGTWQDWVAASSVARSFGRLTPYAGVKCTFLNFKYKIRQNGAVFQQGTYKNDGHVGVLFGTDYVLGRQEDVVLNVETAYVNGAEITATLHYTF